MAASLLLLIKLMHIAALTPMNWLWHWVNWLWQWLHSGTGIGIGTASGTGIGTSRCCLRHQLRWHWHCLRHWHWHCLRMLAEDLDVPLKLLLHLLQVLHLTDQLVCRRCVVRDAVILIKLPHLHMVNQTPESFVLTVDVCNRLAATYDSTALAG